MTPTLQIALATPRDFRRVRAFLDCELRRDYFFANAHLRQILRGRYHAPYVADYDATLVAFAVISRRPDRLTNLIVKRAYRSRGFGTAILADLAPRLVRAKLDMYDGDARSWYLARGYRRTKCTNPDGTTEDLIRKDLVGGPL